MWNTYIYILLRILEQYFKIDNVYLLIEIKHNKKTILKGFKGSGYKIFKNIIKKYKMRAKIKIRDLKVNDKEVKIDNQDKLSSIKNNFIEDVEEFNKLIVYNIIDIYNETKDESKDRTYIDNERNYEIDTDSDDDSDDDSDGNFDGDNETDGECDDYETNDKIDYKILYRRNSEILYKNNYVIDYYEIEYKNDFKTYNKNKIYIDKDEDEIKEYETGDDIEIISESENETDV